MQTSGWERQKEEEEKAKNVKYLDVRFYRTELVKHLKIIILE